MNPNLTIFPAGNGDAFLLEVEGVNILIDGGYVDTYKNFIKDKLIQLSKIGQSLSYVIVTHIDNDHISGIIKLIEENKNENIIKIENIWHNSFRHIKDLEVGLNYQGKSISHLPINYFLKEDIEDIYLKKDISAAQGSTLASLLNSSEYNWNAEFNQNAIVCENELEIKINGDITIKLLSPNIDALIELKKYWKKELYKMGYASDENLSDFSEDAFEYILSLEKEKLRFKRKNVSTNSILNIEELSKVETVEDDRPTNGSSISFIIEYKHRCLLFLSDSFPSVIIRNLHKHYRGEEFPKKFDLIKVSHHGSSANTSAQLLELIDSDTFIFSTNGKIHNHPDIETIAKVIYRNTSVTRKLYFNYKLEKIDFFKDTQLMKKYNYKIIENENLPLKIQLDSNEENN